MNLISVNNLISSVDFTTTVLGVRQCKIFLKNKWALSVLSGINCRSNGIDTFEVAVINPKGEIDYSLYYDTFAYLTADEVKELICQVSEF